MSIDPSFFNVIGGTYCTKRQKGASWIKTPFITLVHSDNHSIVSTATMENYPLSKEETSLLTLSRRDLSSTKNDKIDDSETLVLMQMPASMSAKDIQGARIIASPTQQACLVLKDTSYSMSRVETSNAYIMVPPMTPSSLQERPRKKCKTTDTTLVSVPARLLQSGGSGASFIELKKKNLLLSDLEKQLQYCVFDPFDASKTWTGKPIDELAVSLQCSETQVLQGLKRIQALGITNEGTTCYGLLSEEALQEAKTSILATLMECDDFSDYAGTGISEKTCVEQVMSRVPSGETYTYMDQVIQHTLRTLQSDDNVAGDGDKIQLDVKKVRKQCCYFCCPCVWLSHNRLLHIRD